MPSPDSQLVGWWKVQSITMPEGKTLGLIGGLPGERVCFSEAGQYNVFPDHDSTQRFRCRLAQPYRELDIWIRVPDSIREMWSKNQQIAKQNGASLTAETFAVMFVDANVPQ